MVIDSADPELGLKRPSRKLPKDMWDIQMVFEFDYPYDDFPQELQVVLTATYEEKSPFVTLTWYTPEGEPIKIADVTAKRNEVVRFDLQDRLVRQLDGIPAQIGLLMIPGSDPPEVQQGTYELHIDTIVFEEGSDIDAQIYQYGQVHGAAGTDHRRRELSLALLWGAPIALSFGLLAALGRPSPPCSLRLWVCGLAA
jgi:peptide/nickel transport system permease protein